MNISPKQSHHGKYLVVAVLMFLFLTSLPGVIQGQVRFEMRPFESMTLAGDAFLRGEAGKAVVLAGELRIPKPGSDKLPAVILMHAASGITPAHLDRWAQELNSIGIAVFLLDSGSGRGIDRFPTDIPNLGSLQLLVDAYRALDMLAKHPRIDPNRVAVMGFSMGATPAVYSSSERFWKMYGSANVQFAAHIGVYGSCNTVFRDQEKVTGKPIRLFKGTPDDWGPIEPCLEYVSRLKQAGADVMLTEYPGATHQYDYSNFKEPIKVPQAPVRRNCSLVEGERGQLIDAGTGKPFDPSVSCTEKGSMVVYNEAATVATTVAVKEFLTTTFGLKR
jgi:dienelactone hydrolase